MKVDRLRLCHAGQPGRVDTRSCRCPRGSRSAVSDCASGSSLWAVCRWTGSSQSRV